MSKSPAFQFYPADFLSDGNQLVMELHEAGAYIRLICVCWKEGRLPADLRKLAKMCGTTLKQMERMWPALEVCFVPESPGFITHPRLAKELAKQDAFREKARIAGRLSAEKRNARSTPVQRPLDSSTKVDPTLLASAVSSSSSSPLKKKPRARATALPEGWAPNDHHREIAKANGVDVADELEGMRDWAKSHGTRRLDWDATFNGWLRRAKQFAPRSTGNPREQAKEEAERQVQREFSKRHAGMVPVIQERKPHTPPEQPKYLTGSQQVNRA